MYCSTSITFFFSYDAVLLHIFLLHFFYIFFFYDQSGLFYNNFSHSAGQPVVLVWGTHASQTRFQLNFTYFYSLFISIALSFRLIFPLGFSFSQNAYIVCSSSSSIVNIIQRSGPKNKQFLHFESSFSPVVLKLK